MTELSKTYDPSAVEGAIYERWLAADVFAPDGRGSTADPALPTFTIIQPPPNVTGSLHIGHAQRTTVEDLMTRHARMRGHAALLLPGLDHASIAAQFVMDGILAKEGEDRALARPRALPRADPRVLRFDEAGDAGAAAPPRRLVRLGPPALHDGRGLGQGRPRRLRAALPRRPRVPDRGAGQLVPRLPHLGQRPGGGGHAGDRLALDDPLPPHRRGDRGARAGRDDLDRHDPARDAAGRHRRSGPARRSTLRRARRAARAHPVRRARRAGHRRRDGRPGIRHRRGQDHAGARPRRPCHRPPPWPAGDHDPRRRRDDRRDGDAVRRPRPVRRPTADRRRPRGAGRPAGERPPRDGRRPLPAQLGHRRAAPEDPVVHPDRTARRPGARRDPFRPDAHPAGPLREDLGALADHDPRLERQPPAVVGPPHPGVVLPGRARHGLVARGRPGRVRRPAAGRPPSSPRTRTSSTRGSAPGCGRSRPSAGRTTRPTTGASTRRR